MPVTLRNDGARVAFKVKCSNNNEYGIQPIYGYIPTSGTVTLTVTRLPGRPKEDIMVLQWIEVKDDTKEPKQVFATATPASIQSITVPLLVMADLPTLALATTPKGPKSSMPMPVQGPTSTATGVLPAKGVTSEAPASVDGKPVTPAAADATPSLPPDADKQPPSDADKQPPPDADKQPPPAPTTQPASQGATDDAFVTSMYAAKY
ncbi:hypothetical protein KIN20_001581 [Parelaphostrongylus tenuis]|uniref:Major sperm protein n=1 Tax=Parelaphostrongylus tenuis TaxID=148309 RepID=A0AAD5MMC4_PARTN|nr:hypothetical protein KIN20_001581 [Parelaphostrongylus tenuis]